MNAMRRPQGASLPCSSAPSVDEATEVNPSRVAHDSGPATADASSGPESQPEARTQSSPPTPTAAPHRERRPIPPKTGIAHSRGHGASPTAELARDVRDYEPHLALVAGPTGMEIFERLVGEATGRLVPGGWLVMEIHPQLVQALRDLFQSDPRWSDVGIAKDLAGLPRVIKARWKP